MDTNNLVLEIGTEEIPSRFMTKALEDLVLAGEAEFKESRIDHGAIKTYGTPRRLVLSVKGLSDRQSDLMESFKGPAWSNAFDGSGNPTRAAQGFAKSKGIEVNDLEKRDVDGVPYVFAVVSEKGAPSSELLPDIMCRIISRLSFPKSMYWKKSTVRFARPIRWILCLLGSKVVPFELNGIPSGNTTRGHRFMGASSIVVDKESSYMERLYDNYVIVDQEKRKEKMLSSITVLEKEIGGSIDRDPDLIEENLFLVEYPLPFYGSFDKKYLELPEEVLVTTMKHHQKYFPVRDRSGKLMPYFVGVSNNRAISMDIIREGNQRVLRARLEDASFFWKEDRKVSLAERVDGLKKVVYQEKLGSVYEKVTKVTELSRFICDSLGDSGIIGLVDRAASIAKSDLLTNMVGEFPELQGVMGREYALKDGEDSRVALAMYEQYLPRFAGDSLPSDVIGAYIGLGERIFNLVGAYKTGFRPSGSQDPYGLRRAVRCINEIIWGMDLNLDLDETIDKAGKIVDLDADGMAELIAFGRQRTLIQLKEKGFSHELSELSVAVAGEKPLQALRYLKALDSVRGEEWFSNLITSAVRVGNILSKNGDDRAPSVDSSLLCLEQEKELFNQMELRSPKVASTIENNDWDGLMEVLYGLSPAVSDFFEGVMVMDKDDKVRGNRLALLAECDSLFKKIGDISRLKG
ncbi:glycine--tRNA ligase subunit beta [Dethiosulfovibrio salsuginis]|uniref:Glycine--tRNA ligase beta subunit n=1 Tax=Dethiosulfovibrio salsuginis TaxID=561720 RepID=A0A1X7KTP2_9BACT|nr:glycine--tRNA ligase subunit beta [Dethiosulfovibrio salsuginis]SMG44834.1 glycyl-tRNA synthetase beta chain [Dethiosulfovibrio salsuginis]